MASQNEAISGLRNQLSTFQSQPNLQPAIDQLRVDLTSANSKVTELENRIAALEAKIAAQPVVPAIPTGVVTVEIVGQTPLQIISTPTPTTNQFSVKVTNSTTSYQYVSYGLMLIALAPPVAIDNLLLDTFGISGMTYVYTPIPNMAGAQQIIISQTSLKFAIAAGATITLQHILTISSVAAAQWEGNLTGVVVSTTW